MHNEYSLSRRSFLTAAAVATAGVAAAVERHGRIDAFFNNAGIEGAIAQVEDYPTDTFDRVLAVNLRGVYLSMKHELKAMLATAPSTA